MAISVTNVVKMVKQPRGGYINPKNFKVVQLDDGKILAEESLPASLIGTAVDYLTRYMLGSEEYKAFEISMLGAKKIDETVKAVCWLYELNRNLDDKCIIAALNLVGYDVCFRAGVEHYVPVEDYADFPDKDTIENVRIMVNRSLEFFKKYGPVVKDGFTLEGGYTEKITNGDGDFLTSDTVWDFKVSTKDPTSAHTFQLLLYYLMGKHSVHKEFQSVNKIGFFNPRLNKVYTYDMNDFSEDVRREIEKDIIGY